MVGVQGHEMNGRAIICGNTYVRRCQCGNCMIMDTSRECRCCKETDFETLLHDCDPPAQCITLHPDFAAACLNKTTLKIAYFAYQQQYGDQIDDLNE